jgi:hypothetical protein
MGLGDAVTPHEVDDLLYFARISDNPTVKSALDTLLVAARLVHGEEIHTRCYRECSDLHQRSLIESAGYDSRVEYNRSPERRVWLVEVNTVFRRANLVMDNVQLRAFCAWTINVKKMLLDLHSMPCLEEAMLRLESEGVV